MPCAICHMPNICTIHVSYIICHISNVIHISYVIYHNIIYHIPYIIYQILSNIIHKVSYIIYHVLLGIIYHIISDINVYYVLYHIVLCIMYGLLVWHYGKCHISDIPDFWGTNQSKILSQKTKNWAHSEFESNSEFLTCLGSPLDHPSLLPWAPCPKIKQNLSFDMPIQFKKYCTQRKPKLGATQQFCNASYVHTRAANAGYTGHEPWPWSLHRLWFRANLTLTSPFHLNLIFIHEGAFLAQLSWSRKRISSLESLPCSQGGFPTINAGLAFLLLASRPLVCQFHVRHVPLHAHAIFLRPRFHCHPKARRPLHPVVFHNILVNDFVSEEFMTYFWGGGILYLDMIWTNSSEYIRNGKKIKGQWTSMY